MDYNFEKDGLEILPYLELKDYLTLKLYAVTWLQRLFNQYGIELNEDTLKKYHLNELTSPQIHGEILKASNRHCIPPPHIFELLLNKSLKNFLDKVKVTRYTIWNEGYGSLAFRLIRPNRGDGYPYSCKDWGPAKGIISVWIPILGFSKTQILSVVPGSHLKTYASYLPVDGIHMKNEYRLLEPLALELTDRPVLQPGEAIVFHSKTIHSEDVIEGDETRLNLEFRLLPQ
jgi:hypothetical protein